MGISIATFKMLCELKKDGVHAGRICQLGRQKIHFTHKQAAGVLRKFNIDFDVNLFSEDDLTITDVEMFKALGYSAVESIDVSDYQEASLHADLNVRVKKDLHRLFDVIYDGGTIEHVFNVPMVLENIHKMLKENGIVIHGTPSTNHVDHGFYMISPTLYHDYYGQNNYNIIRSYIFEYAPKTHDRCKWKIYDNSDGKEMYFSNIWWKKNALGVWFVAKKNGDSKGIVVPQQGRYVQIWDKSKNRNIRSTDNNGVFVEYIKKNINPDSFFYSFLSVLYNWIRSYRKPSPIAKY